MFSRRDWLRSAVGALAAKSALGQAAERPPNVLFLSVDDLNDWIGALDGHPQTLTPNIDALAQRGVLFRKAYCQAPSCNPSRTSLMTGLRPSTSGVYRNRDWWRDALPTAVTLPKHFMLHGYEVGGGGKVFHGSQNDAQSWEFFYDFEGFLHPPDTPVNQLNSGHFDWSSIDAADAETADGKLADWASGYLAEEHDRPFFLAVGFYRPHLPFYAPEKYFEKFPEAATDLPPYLENDLDDVPEMAHRSQSDHDKVTSTGQWKRAVASYLACIHFADAQVGKVLEALDNGPNSGNTVIVLWTDHGWQLGEKNQWRKFTLWERSCHVPLMFAGPGVSARGECERTVELLDIYPTLIDLAGLPGRPELDGASLRPLLGDPSAEWDRAAISELGPDRRSVRTERWRFIEYPDGNQLYDHETDPNEWRNLAGDPDLAEVERELAALLPENPSRKQVAPWSETPESARRLTRIPEGRFHKPDPSNELGLESLPVP